MRKTLLAKEDIGQLALLVLTLASLSYFFYSDTITLFPAFIHSWTQSDRYALALGFLDNGFDFFHPKTLNLQTVDGITRVDFPINEYIVAILMKITGSTSPAIFRLYTLFYSMVGISFLFLLTKKITGSVLKAWIVALFAFTAPVYVYYQAGFLPSVTAVSNIFIGYYFYFEYKSNHQKKNLFYAILFFTLAALTRMPFLIFFIAIFLQQALQSIRNKKLSRYEAGIFLTGFVIFIAYNLYNVHLGRIYGNMFLTHLVPARSLHEFKQVLSNIHHQWFFQYFSTWHYLLLFIAIFIGVIASYKKKFPVEHLQYWLQLFIAGCGVSIYFVLMSAQFTAHDYYFLDSFFIPVILFFIFLLNVISFDTLAYKIVLPVLGFSLLFIATKESKHIQTERYSTGPWDRVEITRQNFMGTDLYLDAIGIPKEAKIMVIDAYTTNVPLILMQRKGYTVIGTSRKNITTSLNLYNYDYVAVSDLYLVSDVIKNYPEMINLFEKVGGTGKVSFYKRRERIIPATLQTFFGINKSNTLYHAFINFDTTITDAQIQGTENVNTDFCYSKPKAALFYDAVEFGAGVSLKANEAGSTQAIKVLVLAKVLCREQLGDIHLVASISNPNESVCYQSFNLNEYTIQSKEWQSIQFQFALTPFKTLEDELKVYWWNQSKSKLFYDDFEVTIYQ